MKKLNKSYDSEASFLKQGTLKLQDVTEQSEGKCFSTLEKEKQSLSTFTNYLASLNIHVRCTDEDDESIEDPPEITSIWAKNRGGNEL